MNTALMTSEEQRQYIFSFPIEVLWECWPPEHKGVIYLQAMLAAIEAPAEPGETHPLDELERLSWHIVLEQSQTGMTDRQRELCPQYRQFLDEDPEMKAAACRYGRSIIRAIIDAQRKQNALTAEA